MEKNENGQGKKTEEERFGYIGDNPANLNGIPVDRMTLERLGDRVGLESTIKLAEGGLRLFNFRILPEEDESIEPRNKT